jgi:hypothetical protein
MAAQETSTATAEAASLLAARDERFAAVWPKLSLQEKNTIGQPGYDFFNKLAPKIRHSFPKNSGSDADVVRTLFQDLYTERGYGAKLPVPLRVTGAGELLKLELPKLEVLLPPWLCEKNLVMVHSKRGVGKTHFAFACGYAIASGCSFLGWCPPRPRGVLYIDGEMSVQLMQQRLAQLVSANGEIPERLLIVTPDLQEQAMPDLATREGQASIDALVLPDTALIIIDNLSCLVRSGGQENESESWGAVSEWALAHRRAGRAVMFIHHSGKSGAQRGTSKREDLLDTVINLRHPAEYAEADGAAFEVRFEKARSLTGEDIAPLDVRLETREDGVQVWAHGPAATATAMQIKALWELGGMTLIDIARELCINKSTGARALAKAMEAGELIRPYPSRPRKNATQGARNQL